MPASRVTSNSPWHLVFVLDDSASMEGDPAAALNKALDMMIEEMKLISQGTKPYFKLSVISFGTKPHVIDEVASEQTIDKSKITSFSGSSGSTDMAAALAEAAAVLNRHPGKPTEFEPFVFMLTDGQPDSESAALSAAQAIRHMEVAAGKPRLIAIGLGPSVNMGFLQQVATNPELAKHLVDPTELTKFFPQIGTVVSSVGGAQGAVQTIIDI
jgi:uncharacterized protein YegL